MNDPTHDHSQFIKACLSVTIVALTFTSSSVFSEDARYQFTFDASWSRETHPVDFPSNPHFSVLIGGTHNENVKFWEPGTLASDGIESMAETGSTVQLASEVEAAISAGTAHSVIRASSIPNSPGSSTFKIDVTESHSLLTLVSMIAPSPDGFVGVRNVELNPNGEWLAKEVFELFPYDAGTDSGTTFASANDDTNPAEPITRLSGFPFEDSPPLGTFKLLRLVTGDLNETGTFDVGDVDTLARVIQQSSSNLDFDLNGDSIVNKGDHVFWVKNLANTFIGDANLDGEFNSSDLTTIFQFGEYEDGIAENSRWATGDWNGDFEFDTTDLVAAFQDGGFETGPRVVNSVPEPDSILILVAGVLSLLFGIRRGSWHMHEF